MKLKNTKHLRKLVLVFLFSMEGYPKEKFLV